MVCLVLFETGFHLPASNAELLNGVIRWLTLQQITLNNFENTMQITAGVTWTLKYEYLFYLLIPLIALFTKRKELSLLSALFVLYFAYNPQNIIVDSVLQFNSVFFMFFLFGGVAAYIEFNYALSKIVAKLTAWLGIAALIFVLFYFDSSYSFVPAILLGLFFLSVVMSPSL